MVLGQSVGMLGESASSAGVVPQRRGEDSRASERRQLRAWLRSDVLPGLDRLADAGRDASTLRSIAAGEARRLRAALEHAEVPVDVVSIEADERRAREEEREWVRGHLHDTALQILEFIAGDGFGTGLSSEMIANLAGGAVRDLRRWLDTASERSDARLVPELEQVAAEARALDPGVRLIVGDLAAQPTAEQALALSGAAREAMTNARKHAHASQVVVRVESGADGRTAVTVTDDGVGFDPEAARGGGRGVSHSILGRMRRVGGHASLEPAPGGGTCVTLVTSPAEASA